MTSQSFEEATPDDKSSKDDALLFKELGEKYGRPLYQFFFSKLQNAYEADECVSQTFENFFRSLKGSFDRQRPLEPFLRAIAKNVLKNHFRSSGRHQAHLISDEEAANYEIDKALDPELSIEESYDLEELRQVLNSTVAHTKLSEFQYKIMKLYLDGYSPRGIADKLGVAPKSVRHEKNRAIEKLRKSKGLLKKYLLG